jgi:PAS domain S-box-containing protein
VPGVSKPDHALPTISYIDARMNTLSHTRHSLKTRITLATLTIFVIGLWSLSYFASSTLRQDMEHQIGAQQASAASLVAANIEQELQDRLTWLERSAKALGEKRLNNSAALQAFLEDRIVAQQFFNGGLIVTDASGTAVGDFPRSAGRLGVNYMDRESVSRAIREGKSNIGIPGIGKAQKVPVLVLAVPIRDSEDRIIGSFLGVLYLSKTNFLDDILEDGYGRTGGYLVVTPQYNLIVTATDKRRVMEILPPPGVSPAVDRRAQGDDSTMIFVNPVGDEVLSSAKRIPLAGWYVAVIMPTTEAFTPIRDMQQRMLLGTILLTLLAGALTWWMLRRQLAPMMVTATLLAKMADGKQPSQALPSGRDDEIGALVGGFNHLLETLEQRGAALVASEARFRDMVNTTDGIVWEADATTFRFTFVSHKAALLLGYPVEAWYEPGFWVEHLHPDDKEWGPEYRASCTGRIEPHDFEYRFIAKDGRTVWLQDIVTVVAENDAPRWLRGIMIDITERKLAENALHESEALFRAVSESAHDAIVTADSSGKIIKWNPGATNMFGYSESETIGRSLTLLMPGRFRDLHSAGMSRVSAGSEPRVMGKPVELAGLRKDGSEFPLELALGRWQIAERQFFTGVIRDITERKKIERKLENQKEHLEELVATRTQELSQAKEAAETASIAKSAFLANMSHEIRTPLNAITGMAHILRRGGLTPQQTDKIDKIENAGNHLLHVINDVLDLSKIEADKFALEDAPVHVEAMLGNIASMLGQKAQDKGLCFNIETSAVPHNLHGDPTRLQQALLNYASNALKFTETGHITLRVKEEAQTDESTTLRFEVEDTGIGIAPEALAKLFSAFEQADNSTTRKYGGTGLGLAVTKKIAEVMGGTAGATSIAGQGSTFWFTAVLRKGQSTAEEATRTKLESAEQLILREHAGKRILLAEDEPINREIAQMLLEDAGLKLDHAGDGEEAVAKARLGGYAAILMDMQMPVLDGLNSTRQIRELPGCETIPILAMTANAFAEDKDRCFEAGMDDFISKPVVPEVLFETLLKWLERERS